MRGKDERTFFPLNQQKAGRGRPIQLLKDRDKLYLIPDQNGYIYKKGKEG